MDAYGDPGHTGLSRKVRGGLMELRYFVFKPMDNKVEWYTYSVVANDGEGAFIIRNEASQGSFELIQANPLPGIH